MPKKTKKKLYPIRQKQKHHKNLCRNHYAKVKNSKSSHNLEKRAFNSDGSPYDLKLNEEASK